MYNRICYLKKKNNHRSRLYLSFLILIIISISSFRIIELNINQEFKESYNNKFLNSSNSNLIILTPENKTYNKPDRGYFPGTYGFENHEDGTNGLDIDFINEYYSAGSNTDIKIIEDELFGHRNYLKISDLNPSNNTWAVHYLDTPQSYGTLEFYNCYNNNVSGSTIRQQIMQFRASDDTIAFQIQINHHNGTLNYFDGTAWQLIANTKANIWYHHKVLFDCNAEMGKFIWVIKTKDGTEIVYLDNIDFENNFNGRTIDEIYFETSIQSHGIESYWDAFGYVWDPNYNYGENLNEGLLFSYSYINTTLLTWTGYSIDGEMNKTITGNLTIPLPIENGKHSIQIFGTLLNGTTLSSEERIFSIFITFNNPSSIDIVLITIIILSVAGVSIPSTYLIINYEIKRKSQKKEKQKDRITKAYIKRKYLNKYIKIRKSQRSQLKIDLSKLSPIPQEIPTIDESESLAHEYSEKIIQKFMDEKCQDFVDQCAMHKESFDGPGYECYECHTKFCVKCAFTLAEKNVGCIVCGKPIPILFKNKKQKKALIKAETNDIIQIFNSNLNNIFKSEKIMEKFTQSDMNLTFFDKDFYKKVRKLELNESEKQLFIEDMIGLTPKERFDIIEKMLERSEEPKIDNVDEKILQYSQIEEDIQKIFESKNPLETIDQSKNINLTFFDKNFYDELKELELDEEEKKEFVKDMLSLTPKERIQFLKKMKKQSQ